MSIVNELSMKPGVITAGEYAYRGDRFSYKRGLTEEHARMASIMCRATTMSVNMEGGMIASLWPQSGLQPVHGWVVKGPRNTVCVVANVFCFIDNEKASLNKILDFMRRALVNETMDLV